MRKRNMQINALLTLALAATATTASASTDTPTDTIKGGELKEVEVRASTGTRSKRSVINAEVIGRAQLNKAACCNLGESFTASPSVDVNYSDATTGARMIKLLGLGGSYVQMMTENVPALRGAALPYSLGYVPGTWMNSIQVSKGAASVKNGYESTTGQINIEYLKPQDEDGVRANGYLDTNLKYELNADGNIHLSDKLSTSLLLHFENRQTEHDSNGDGFMDMPKLQQINLMNRWALRTEHWFSQLFINYLHDKRVGGQSEHHATMTDGMPLYRTEVKTDRAVAQWKNAYLFNDDANSSIALMLQGSWQKSQSAFGLRQYDVTQKSIYAQLMYETDLTDKHNISVGASLLHDRYDETSDVQMISRTTGTTIGWGADSETTAGLYAQYTYKPSDKLSVMPGVRWDYSSLYHGFFTPRVHVKYAPTDVFTLRTSAGKGFRTSHVMAENVSLLASGRTFYRDQNLQQEEAWNMGASFGFHIPVAGKTLEINADYYYTTFLHQAVVNIDGALGTSTVAFENLDGTSRSHCFEIDATYPFARGLSVTVAYRFNDVRTTYDGVTKLRPLTSRYKVLLTASYQTPLKIWQFDITGTLNGGGRLYNDQTYPAYVQLQAQVTREFRYFSVYLGGENLTNYRMQSPVINPMQPYSSAFDATQVWGPTDGAMAYVGIRFKVGG